jgi:hypothetical protein
MTGKYCNNRAGTEMQPGRNVFCRRALKADAKAVDADGTGVHNNQRRNGESIMSTNSSQADFQKILDGVARILIRCFLGGMGLLVVWFAAYVAAGDWIYQMHSQWFQIPRQTFDAIHYAGMAVTKIAIIIFFLLPWLAIKIISGKQAD